MARCEVCGNDYHMSFQVITAGQTHTFDSFECAIHKLAPVCEHCGCKIVGHGIEAEGTFFCCAHCARESGVPAAVDHVSTFSVVTATASAPLDWTGASLVWYSATGDCKLHASAGAI